MFRLDEALLSPEHVEESVLNAVGKLPLNLRTNSGVHLGGGEQWTLIDNNQLQVIRLKSLQHFVRRRATIVARYVL
jgi:hypothetical protein